MRDILFLIGAVVGGAFWGWMIHAVRLEHRLFPARTRQQGIIAGLAVSAAIGLLVGICGVLFVGGCSIDEEKGYDLPPPDIRCSGLTFEACLARVMRPDASNED